VLYGGTPAPPQLIAKTGDSVPARLAPYYARNPIAGDQP